MYLLDPFVKVTNNIKYLGLSTYHEINDKNEFTVLPSTVIYLLSGKKHRFVVENNSQILGEKTTNPESTIANTKWAFILSWLWGEVLKAKENEELKVWADLGGGNDNISELGIGQQYRAAKTIEITPEQDDVWLGSFHRMEVFSTRPNKGLFFHFVVIDKPKIYLAYFDKQSIKPEVKNFTINDGYYSYGQVIKFYVATHMLPMKIGEQYSEKYGKVDTETSFENLEFEIELTDESHNPLLEEPILKGKLVDYSPIVKEAEGYTRISSGTANIQYEFPIFIDTKWKDNIHNKKDKTKAYSVTIKIINTKTKKEYPFTPNMNQIRRVADNKKDFDDIEVSPIFMVKYESMDTILSQMEDKKSNMIQYIGDIDYNNKESNPCAYSKITINNGEKDFEIFNEYKLSGKEIKDSTQGIIDIVCGDKETKDIKITAKFLPSKDDAEEHVRTDKNGFKCQMILNDGKPHNGIYDVFKMNWVVGQWVPSQDPALFAEHYMKMIGLGNKPSFFHPSNGSSSPKLEWNKSDQEAKGIESPNKNEYQNVSVAGIQGLAEETDYTISEAEDSITLKLKYNYNKSYDDKILNYLYGEQEYLTKGFFDENFKNIWVIRYLLKWVKNERISQTYFVPVTTCRYLNQIAQIRAYPDMKWVINFNYNIETPLYYKATTPLVEHYSSFNEGKINTSNNNKRKEILDKKISNGLQHYVGRKTTFGLYVECEVSGEDEVFKLGNEFGEKYREMCAPLFFLVESLDNTLGISDAEEENRRLLNAPSTKKGLLGRLSALPMSFELNPPSLGLGVGIGYSTSQNGNITYEVDARIKADPIIGAKVTLDILALGSKLKPWGAIVDALDIASWLINFCSAGKIEIDYKVEVRFTAEIKLVGKKTKEETKTEPAEYESEAKFTYNLADRNLDFHGGIQGKILGEIEISTSVKIKANIKDAQGKPAEEPKNITELSIGVKASSSVSLTCPFKLNKEGKLDLDLEFSGVKLEIWFKAGLNMDEEDSEEPDKIVPLIPKVNFKKSIEF
ncbi:hypothetical protein NAL32_21840 [Chryseobacterium sp. Ch-15]|uniref:Uncharacterized protein n=1 Tax=Chryseobacterium muglaense TaxID=2893752 RepID=A0A9Q3UU38_9FLAO|nr:hypothetical protein [Chryseobacterium muglaense]MCC9033511.1 hypothetical protein [Chryseobacterium muglaense]MCM2557032.1 hypothetical protein [Chryseobacterium muglaense]